MIITEAKDTEIFVKYEDYADWEKLIKHCETLEGFTELEKEKAKRAFKFLKEEFREDFLKDAFTNRHPITQYIVNLAPWTRKWITWLAEYMKELKGKENYPRLLEKLEDSEKFREALPVLEIGYKFSKAGFSVSIEPSVNAQGRVKIPDLKLVDKNTNEEMFVEVSVLGESKIATDAYQTMQRISELLWQSIPFMYYCGRIHKTLSERHLSQIVKKVKEAVQKS